MIRRLLMVGYPIQRVRRYYSSVVRGLNDYFHIDNEVEVALRERSAPVIALESTIITHGMPYPKNVETALEVESIIREGGSIPATIGILNGKVNIGMKREQINELALAENCLKVSRHNLPEVISKQYSGGTTVAATMLLAHKCGMEYFVTGGIGGVHRMGEVTMDVSCDLRQLGRTSLTLVCAGVKSILDIPKTLEYLETEGVSVATLGSNDFPAFFTPSSGIKSPIHLSNQLEAVSLIKAHRNLDIDSGILLAVPIPQHLAASAVEIQDAIEMALKEVSEKKITGKDVTPYVLERVNEQTQGRSLEANISLIKHNAMVGSMVARKYHDLHERKVNNERKEPKQQAIPKRRRPVVVGGANLDVIAKPRDCSNEMMKFGPSNKAVISMYSGGVARNIAENLMKLETNPFFISAIGSDTAGDFIINELKTMDLNGMKRVKDEKTAVYNGTLNKEGELYLGMIDDQIHNRINRELLKSHEDELRDAAIICIDGNLSHESIKFISDSCARFHTPLLFEPAEMFKAPLSFRAGCYPSTSSTTKQRTPYTYTTPNLIELKAIYQEMTGLTPSSLTQADMADKNQKKEVLESIILMAERLVPYSENVITTLGEHGVLLVNKETRTYYPLEVMTPLTFLSQPIVNVSGSGDSFTAALISALLGGMNIDDSICMGMTVAQITARSSATTAKKFNLDEIELSPSVWKRYQL